MAREDLARGEEGERRERSAVDSSAGPAEMPSAGQSRCDGEAGRNSGPLARSLDGRLSINQQWLRKPDLEPGNFGVQIRSEENDAVMSPTKPVADAL
ncbi:unnamed protein product [Clonostachys rhizophaga]|uniref:Uncharacterized protein n=1 Tax=Clonostachys rhizophaga TaxID=160324 RepID=A0A9N9V7V9_9HYPO|nr:unnamed protein product [Clonostachys rhizophaga]